MKKKTIPGIYNYCDRWCERCTLTNRCAIYEDPECISRPKDVQQPFRRDFLSVNLGKIKTTQEEAALEHGLNLTLSEVPNAWRTEETPIGQMRKQHPLSIRSLDYDMCVFRWMAFLDVDPRHIGGESSHLSKIQESTAVIARYSPFIHIKLCRAINSVITTDEWAEENGLQKDSDGSAKITLIVLKRSLDAWRTLYHALPEFEDDILSFLVSLEQLQKMILEFFPDAMRFVRPGFDTHDGLSTPP